MYKCQECGHVFEKPATWEEPRGECFGILCSEELEGCPKCKCGFDEAEKCQACGEYFLEDELIGDVCKECIDDCKYDIDTCYEIGKCEKQEIKINSFLVAMFDIDEVEDLLLDALKETNKAFPVDCTPFINIDEAWFAERLAEEVNK
jgi:hypothetical protein